MKNRSKRIYKLLFVLGIIILSSQDLQAATLKTINQNNTNLVPLRTISEEFGAKVSFDKNSQKITVIHKDNIIETTIGSKTASVNNKKQELLLAPRVVNGVSYVPIRFIGESLGGEVAYNNGVLTIHLDDTKKEWKLEPIKIQPVVTGSTFKKGSRVVNGKRVTYATINMNDPRVKVKVATAYNRLDRAQPLKSLASGAKVGVNGTYFAAYNGAVPEPDGTLVSNGKTLHITDIGSTIGFTLDNKVLIDFVTTRVQGYINGEESWVSYRINRPTPDQSATIIYTPEYGRKVPIANGWSGIVCINGKVEKIVSQSREVPKNGFIVVTRKPGLFSIGDTVSYKTVFQSRNTSKSYWDNVVYALSAGPSLRINGKKTGNPKDEKFTEAKIVNNVAQRTFIGVNSNNELMIGTVSASVSQLKDIVASLGLKSAMCLDGGASSGLYYEGRYLTSPGRNINNSINFYY
ncbi:MAG: hypothetical protein GX366_02880 [Epulopiscium sp.]|nr:hypothetical protein [Candidatus Epulonipiscium sp.]